MSGRYAGVRLDRITRLCPFCGAPRQPFTHPYAGTVIEYARCRPEKCSRARLAVLNSLRPPAAEILPIDDRNQYHRPRWAQAQPANKGDVA